MKKSALLFGALFAATLAQATTIYSNTTYDTLATVFYSNGPFTELGDQITFNPGQTERRIQGAATQFYNGGTNGGTFDATLRFWQIGPTPPTIQPVGTQIGGDFTVTGLNITQDLGSPSPNRGLLTVSFGNLSGLTLPDNVVWSVSISNVTAGLDLGLNFFCGPGSNSSDFPAPGSPVCTNPSIGTSDLYLGNRFFITNGGSFSYGTTGDPFLDNLYFQVEAVPEPATYAMAAAGLVVIGMLRRRK